MVSDTYCKCSLKRNIARVKYRRLPESCPWLLQVVSLATNIIFHETHFYGHCKQQSEKAYWTNLIAWLFVLYNVQCATLLNVNYRLKWWNDTFGYEFKFCWWNSDVTRTIIVNPQKVNFVSLPHQVPVQQKVSGQHPLLAWQSVAGVRHLLWRAEWRRGGQPLPLPGQEYWRAEV